MTNILEIVGTKYDPDQDLKANLKAAKLAGWNVRHVPVYAVMSDRDIPLGMNAIVRTNPSERTKRDVLGTTRSTEILYTNELMADRLEELRLEMNEGSHIDLEFHSMGELDDGKKVFMALYSAEWEAYLIGIISYDQTIPASIQAAVELPRGGLFTSVDGSVQTGRTPLSSGATQVKEQLRSFCESVRTLSSGGSEVTCRADQARLVIEAALGLPGGPTKKSTLTRFQNKTDQVMEFLPSLAKEYTKWNIFSAICAWVDFSAPVRGAKLGELKTQRAEQSLLRPYRKTDAFNHLFK